jgi:hypothetical protein
MKEETGRITQFSTSDIRALEPAMKIGILGTVTPEGLPHLTMISTLKASSTTQITFGQFMHGRSKAHLLDNPQAGWLIMTLDRHVWRGKARFDHTTQSGPDFDFYNNTPLFRYNAYFGIHTVYYLDLVEQSGKTALPMNRVVLSAVKTMLARSLGGGKAKTHALNSWTVGFFNKMDNLKFIGYIGADGYPVVFPCIQAQAANPERVLFSASVYREEIERIPAGAPLALFGLALTMEDVLVRGRYEGLRRVGGVRCGSLQVDWVYNPMPPVPGQIYPELPLEPVAEF